MWTPAPKPPVAIASTPLFLPHQTPITPPNRDNDSPEDQSYSDSPMAARQIEYRATAAPVASLASDLGLFSDNSPSAKRDFGSPASITSRAERQIEAESSLRQLGPNFGLFSDDSPPTKREVRSPVWASTPSPIRHELSQSPAQSVTTPPKPKLNLFSDDSPPSKRPAWSPAPSSSSQRSQRDPSISPAVSSSSRHSARNRRAPSPSLHRAAAVPQIPTSHAGPSARKTPAKRRAFLDFLAKVDASDEEDDYQYDDNSSESLGSLRDFIVDDDDEVDYQSDDGGEHSGSNEDSYTSDVREVPRRPTIQLDLDPELDLSDANDVDCSSETDLAVDSDIEIAEHEMTAHPKAKASTTPSFLDYYIDSEEDESLETTEIGDELSAAIGGLTLESNGTKSSNSRVKKPVKGPKWALERVRIAQEVFEDLDRRVFEGRLGVAGAGARIVWNKRLLTTAGTAHRKK